MYALHSHFMTEWKPGEARLVARLWERLSARPLPVGSSLYV
jgi:hypothetical protein